MLIISIMTPLCSTQVKICPENRNCTKLGETEGNMNKSLLYYLLIVTIISAIIIKEALSISVLI